MSRYSSSGSYGHECNHVHSRWSDYYELIWTVDYYYADSRLRYPRRFVRLAEEDGARRFCKRWGLLFPGDPHPFPETGNDDAAQQP